MSDHGDIGDDGYVRLRAYRPISKTHFFSASCTRCGRSRSLSVERAIALLGGDDTQTVGNLGSRLRCSGCNTKGISVQVASDSRSPEAIAHEGLLPVIANGEAD